MISELRRLASAHTGGKLFTITTTQLQARYEKWSEFKRLFQRYDAMGKTNPANLTNP
jgi:hypothetical protein